MATIQDFRRNLSLSLGSRIFGAFSGLLAVGSLQFRESHSSYTEEITGFQRGVVVESEGLFAFDTFQVDPLESLDTLQPGQKGYQLRVWVIEEDETIDSNIPALVLGIEVEVHRALVFPDEEFFYANNEMIENQRLLLDKSFWREEVTGLSSLVSGPVISSVPERLDNIIRYTVEASAVLDPS